MSNAPAGNDPERLVPSVVAAKCQSYKRCTAIAPSVFSIGSDGKSTVSDPHGDPAQLVQAARSCPYRAIIVTREGTGEQIFPPLRKPQQ